MLYIHSLCFSKTELRRRLREDEGAVIDVYDVCRVRVGRRRDDLKIDQAVQDRLAVGQNFRLVVVARRIAEGEHDVRGRRRDGRKRVGDGKRADADRRRLGAVEQVPENGRALGVLGENRTRIENRHGGRRIPKIVVHGITVLGQPHLDGLDLTGTEARRRERLYCAQRCRRNGDLEFLLVERDGHEEFMRVEVDVVGDRHTAVDHVVLLDLEVARRELRGDSDRLAVDVDVGRRRVQADRQLYLLRQSVGRKRKAETVVGGTTPDRDGDVGELRTAVIRGRVGHLVAAQLEDGLRLGLRAHLSERLGEELSATHEVLGRPSNTETNLVDSLVAPSAGKSTARDTRRRQRGDLRSREAQHEDDVLEAVSRRNYERRTSGREVGQILAETSVILDRDRLDLGVIRIAIIQIFRFPEVSESTGELSRHVYN